MITIRTRTRITLSIRMRNPKVIEGYVPRIRLYDGIYLEEAIVTNRKGISVL